ncbi:MAG: cyclodeaminase/cyclohydrolase family protein [Clostridia bacterium]|nr:cyclodeaminase/cyclohydrolase family protein [Clostridia bacterium]
MSEVWDWSFRKVVEVSASSSPTPGGGSVSALVGSLGAAMVAMVANLTVGKEKYREVEGEVKGILAQVYELIEKLEQLVERDISDFSNFMQVYKMPKETEEEKRIREEAKQRALKAATDTPFTIAESCLEGLRLAEKLSLIGNKGAISDVGVGAYVCDAALRSALLSVDINLPSISDPDYVRAAQERKAKLISEADALKAKALEKVRERLA